ncbi:hypothetical protein AAHE18_17G063100 [Arachis hypogaea]|nr:uncharacterized protein DS421_17g574140 [Arachis hypogaea]
MLSPPAETVGAIAFFSSSNPSHLSSSTHRRTKEMLTPGINVTKIARSIVILSLSLSLLSSLPPYASSSLSEFTFLAPLLSTHHFSFLCCRHFPSSFAASKHYCFN